MSGRKHPQIRARNAPVLVLQPRDWQILLGVYNYRLLSRKQIQMLYGFGSITRVNTRLRKLFDAKLLDRVFVSTFWGSPVAYYCLGINGIPLIAQFTQDDISEIKRKRRLTLKIREVSLKHLVAVNEAVIALDLAIEEYPDANLEYFTDNIQFISRQRKVLRPDGYFILSCQNRTFAFFLEVDLATESLKVIQHKIEAYLSFGLSGEYERQFGHKYFRVLFICSSELRMQNIWKVISKTTDKMFWLTETDNLSDDVLFDEIWHRPRKPGLFSLI